MLFLNSKFHLFHSWILLGSLDSASLCCTVETTGSKLEQSQGSPCFLSLRDYRPSLPDVQCFKTVASYILPGFLLVPGRKAKLVLLFCLGCFLNPLSKTDGHTSPESCSTPWAWRSVLADLFFLMHWEDRVQLSLFHCIGWDTEAVTQASYSPQVGMVEVKVIKACKILHLAHSLLCGKEILELSQSEITPWLSQSAPHTAKPSLPSAKHTEIYRALHLDDPCYPRSIIFIQFLKEESWDMPHQILGRKG